MRIAFHAPLKAPDHPSPSGDRTMARLLMQALKVAGHDVFLASRLRTREAKGDAGEQNRIRLIARQEASMLSAKLLNDPPDLWFTYHLYYKAPDLIGPDVARALGIPYVAAEASHAEKRLKGPHAHFAADALVAIQQADALVCMTDRDRRGLLEVVPSERLYSLKPFVPTRPRPSLGHGSRPLRLLAVAMMRPGDKMESYRLLASALGRLRNRSWTLTIVGDGIMKRRVRQTFAQFGGRVRFTGRVPESRLKGLYVSHDLLLWPAVNEAYGLALLEATAHGLPVVAGDEGGVADIIRHRVNGLLAPPRDPAAFAALTRRLLDDRQQLHRLKVGSWRQIERGHRLNQAAHTLDGIVRSLCES
ncbi:MAG: glycosyltransferase family 4 protein [Minwuia sp.]|uniref:glycosyltransferase family 4 protein n=1 Tax=Minwuia sp. TaxID=2493630 RepID=UPI003A86EB93